MLRRVASCLLFCSSVLWASAGVDEYALILKDPPLAQSRQQRESAAHQTIRKAQAAAIHEIEARHWQVSGSVQSLLNAVFVLVPHGQTPDFSTVPGVERWSYLPPLHPLLNKALALTDVPAAWANPLIGGMGRAGAGMRIGIIDSGIDQTHPAFQDAQLQPPAGFPRGDTKYTNSKVIVARSYVSLLNNSSDPNRSTPDDTTPADHTGHGTAVAMIAAGEQVNAPLATISGVAPKAFLGNYKIYGSPAVNTFTNASAMIQALEDALTDGMDVVNVASGNAALYGALDADSSACGNASGLRSYIPSNACDIAAQAVENAVRSGMVVVVAAGDDGPTLGTINSPGTAPSAITVGASTNAHIFYSSISVPDVSASTIDALFGIPKPGGKVVYPLADVTASGNDGLACAPLPAGSFTGDVVLVERGGCGFDAKANNVQAAGAVGMVIYLDNATDDIFTPISLEDTAIPSVVIRNSDGVQLHNYLKAHAGAAPKITLDPTLREVAAGYDTVAGFSSRGPAIGTSALIKPELVAVGTDLYTATQNYDPSGSLWDASRYTSVQGTSFAAAMVAGAVALVKQAHPGLSPAQYKSAVVNTTSNAVKENGVTARIEAVGSGKLDAGNAVGIGATVTPSTLSFNNLLSSVGVPATLSMNLTNITNAPGTYSVQVLQTDTDAKASVSVTPASGTLQAQQTVSLSVTLSGSKPSAGMYEGFIIISGIGQTLFVPYWYIVSDGVVQSVFPVIGSSSTGGVSEAGDLIALRAVDRNGLSVSGVPVTFSVLSGGGSIGTHDAATDSYGIAASNINLGSSLGDQIFEANLSGMKQDFFWTAFNFPTIATNGIVNAASFQLDKGFAPGSYLTIAGTNLSAATGFLNTNYLPVSIAGTSVSFDAGGISVPGRLSYVSPTQINVQIPWELQGQSMATVKVNFEGLVSFTATIPIAATNPAFFEFSDAGQLTAAALDQNFRVITAANPVQRGQVVQFFVNGLGAVTNQPADGAVALANPLSTTTQTPGVTIGGQNAPVQFSGLAPGIVGLYQVNAVVPLNIGTGPQTVTLSIGGNSAKTTRIVVK